MPGAGPPRFTVSFLESFAGSALWELFRALASAAVHGLAIAQNTMRRHNNSAIVDRRLI
jgi:hypothetical protein